MESMKLDNVEQLKDRLDRLEDRLEILDRDFERNRRELFEQSVKFTSVQSAVDEIKRNVASMQSSFDTLWQEKWPDMVSKVEGTTRMSEELVSSVKQLRDRIEKITIALALSLTAGGAMMKGAEWFLGTI